MLLRGHAAVIRAAGDPVAEREAAMSARRQRRSRDKAPDAERRAQHLIDEAKAHATEEANKIVAAARVEAEQEIVKAREHLREQVAALAVKGAEQILRKEVNASVHADLLSRLKTEL